MGLLYGRAGRLTAENGGFRPGQWGCAARLLLARGVELDAVDPRNGTTVIPQLVGRTLTLERRGVLYRDQLLQAVKVKLRGQPSVQMPLTGQGGNGQAGKWTQRTIFT